MFHSNNLNFNNKNGSGSLYRSSSSTSMSSPFSDVSNSSTSLLRLSQNSKSPFEHLNDSNNHSLSINGARKEMSESSSNANANLFLNMTINDNNYTDANVSTTSQSLSSNYQQGSDSIFKFPNKMSIQKRIDQECYGPVFDAESEKYLREQNLESKEKEKESDQRRMTQEQRTFQENELRAAEKAKVIIKGQLMPVGVSSNRFAVDGVIIDNLTFKSQAFEYIIEYDSRTVFKKHGIKKIVSAKKITFTPLQLTVKLFTELCRRGGASQKQINEMLSSFPRADFSQILSEVKLASNDKAAPPKLNVQQSINQSLHDPNKKLDITIAKKLISAKRKYFETVNPNDPHIVVQKKGFSKDDSQNKKGNQKIKPDQTELRRYFLFDQLSFIEKFYPNAMHKISEMPWSRIEILYKLLNECPEYLCCTRFYERYKLQWKGEDIENAENVTGLADNNTQSSSTSTPSYHERIYIAELELSDLDRCNISLSSSTRMWIKVYKALKRTYYVNKDMFVSIRNLKTISCESSVEDPLFAKAIEFLKEHEIIVVEKDRYIHLIQPHLHQTMLAETLLELEERHAHFFGETYNIEDITKRKEVFSIEKICKYLGLQQKVFEEEIAPLCNEQREALFKILSNSLSVISGPGGAGKSFTLYVLLRLIMDERRPTKVIATAFQHSNKQDMAEIRPGANFAFTTHALLSAHNRCCNKSPTCKYITDKPLIWKDVEQMDEKQKKDETRVDSTSMIPHINCIFEDVEYLVIDETGLQYPAILAKLVYAIKSCSQKFRAIICSGDYYQLPSIYPGNILEDFTNICKNRYNSFAELTKNHRAENTILFENANRIRNRVTYDIPSMFDEKNTFSIHLEKCTMLDFKRAVVQMVNEHKLEPKTTHFITFTNKMVDNLNEWLDEYFLMKQKGEKEQNSSRFKSDTIFSHYLNAVEAGTDSKNFKYHPYIFTVGCPIVIKMNQAGVINNEKLIITRIYDKKMKNPISNKNRTLVGGDSKTSPQIVQKQSSSSTVAAEIQKEIEIERETTANELLDEYQRFIECETIRGKTKTILFSDNIKKATRKAYATTNYAFIGRQAPNIVFLLPAFNKRENSRTIYTAFSRPSLNFFFIGSYDNLQQSILKDDDLRNTDLQSYIDSVQQRRIKEAKENKNLAPIVKPTNLDSADVGKSSYLSSRLKVLITSLNKRKIEEVHLLDDESQGSSPKKLKNSSGSLTLMNTSSTTIKENDQIKDVVIKSVSSSEDDGATGFNNRQRFTLSDRDLQRLNWFNNNQRIQHNDIDENQVNQKLDEVLAVDTPIETGKTLSSLNDDN